MGEDYDSITVANAGGAASETSALLPKPSSANEITLPDPDVAYAGEVSRARLWTILGATWVGVFLASLDSTIIATLLGPISSSFSSFSTISWVASGYLITNSAFQPLSGRLTDIFGRRAGLIAANIAFGTGTLMCGLAKEEWVLIAGRLIAGAGGGCLNAISTFVASDLVPLRRRGLYQGLGNVVFGTGAGLGGYIGGLFNDSSLGWRWAFLFQIPIIIVSAIAVALLVDIPIRNTSEGALRRVDFFGAFSLVTSLILLLVGLNTGGNILPWTHPLVLTTIPLSIIILFFFIYTESRTKEPIIPVRLLLQRTAWSACLTNWFFVMSIYGLLFYGPFYFQLQGHSATASGLRLLPNSIGLSIGSLSTGYIMRSTGRYYTLGVFINTVFVAAIALITSFNLNTRDFPQFAAYFFVGYGYGGMLTVTLIALISSVDHEFQAVITSASYAFRATGSTIGVTVASAVFQNVLKGQLEGRLGGRGSEAEDVIRRVRESFDYVVKVPLQWRGMVLQAEMEALRAVFGVALGLAAIGWLAGACLGQHKLHMTLNREDEGVEEED
ncbi:hypothetical protein H072_4970 [Dactylellina haptotyla CBS 200.50]|uniref:Major facilitator superfamily (MFS) profile domain-containing protein n=1 Tax=Dactylellina haptotyla (strain CBS 200.50) TaxID=1284197 RepID=S8ADV2_DACHA|nr:hypothetical protein H072_4970 [Dactylellina haptotyla CBS 200.50]